MLGSKFSLSGKDIERFFDRKNNAIGHRMRSEKLVIMYAPNGRPYSRFAVIFPQKVVKGAVVRNRSKRRVRAILYKRKKDIKMGFDIVLTFRERIDAVPHPLLEEIIANAIKKANVYKK